MVYERILNDIDIWTENSSQQDVPVSSQTMKMKAVIGVDMTGLYEPAMSL